nr:ATP-grasp domain-containing protein [uncultured Sellimonas sp.]
MKKLLLLGGIDSFVDLYEDINKENMEVIVCDQTKEVPCYKIASKFYEVSTTDVNKLNEIVEREEIDILLSAFSDVNLMPSYIVSKKHNLKTIYNENIIEQLTNKIVMKKILKKENYPVINYCIIDQYYNDEELRGLEFPVVTKPIDSYGSKGVFICQNPEEVRRRFWDCAKFGINEKNKIIVEEYYPYDEISITAWVKDKKSYITCIYDLDKNYENNIELSRVTFPSKYTDKFLNQIKILVQKLTHTFGITEGPITVQCFIGPRGLKVSEFLYRLAGGAPYRYTMMLGGPNIAQMLVDYLADQSIDYSNLYKANPRSEYIYYSYRVYVKGGQKLFFDYDKDNLIEKVPYCCDAAIYYENGEWIPEGEKVHTRIFCRVKKNQNILYDDILNILEENLVIANEFGVNMANFHKPLHKANLQCYSFKL